MRRIGRRYAPVRPVVSLRGTFGPDRARALRPLLAMLRNLEHNMKPKAEVESWFEWIAENPSVPVRVLPKLDAKFDRYSMSLLRAFDIDMHQEERARESDEPTVRPGIGIYRFEDREELRCKAERTSVEMPTRSQRSRAINSLRRAGPRRKAAPMP